MKPLLDRMARDLRTAGRLHPSTTAWMYTAYAAHAALTVRALVAGPAGARLSGEAAKPAGAALTVAGSALCAAGMGRFGGAGQVSGTRTGPLVRSGVYRWSRNPQYTGYVMALSGAALLRRSPASLALAGVAAVVYRAWVPAEEAHLSRTFGHDYDTYLAETPRWLGVPRPRGSVS
jgi:protein-S-isoprenylcysteine O-methyltransferase Ste14